jgi:hypothetical protein
MGIKPFSMRSMQDYTFSPQGATFQHEDLRLDLAAMTHLKLTIVPNKPGSGRRCTHIASAVCIGRPSRRRRSAKSATSTNHDRQFSKHGRAKGECGSQSP